MMRLAMKTATYGATHLVVATAVAYAITGNLAMAMGIGVLEPIVQTGVFALHDAIWEKENRQGHSCREGHGVLALASAGHRSALG